VDSDADALQWAVLQVPQVGAVAGVGRHAAGWAGSTARPSRGNRPLRRHSVDAKDPNAGEPLQQRLLFHAPCSRRPGPRSTRLRAPRVRKGRFTAQPAASPESLQIAENAHVGCSSATGMREARLTCSLRNQHGSLHPTRRRNGMVRIDSRRQDQVSPSDIRLTLLEGQMLLERSRATVRRARRVLASIGAGPPPEHEKAAPAEACRTEGPGRLASGRTYRRQGRDISATLRPSHCR
jgi:hypothetical protein